MALRERYTAAEAAAILRESPDAVRRKMAAGTIRAYRKSATGGRSQWITTAEWLDEYSETQTTTARTRDGAPPRRIGDATGDRALHRRAALGAFGKAAPERTAGRGDYDRG